MTNNDNIRGFQGALQLGLGRLSATFFKQNTGAAGRGSIPMEMKANLEDNDMTPADYHGKNLKTMIPVYFS